jgi:hypothetical protein
MWDNSVSKVTGYESDNRNSIHGRGWEFSLRLRVQTVSGVHPAHYSMGQLISFTGMKRMNREAHNSPSNGAEVQNAYSSTF